MSRSAADRELKASSAWRVVHVPLDRSPIDNPLLHALGRGEPPPGFPLFDFDTQPGDEPALVDRTLLVDELTTSNAALGNPLPEQTRQAIGGDAWFVVTGQQPGLWLGPMYTLLKALTAIRVADELQQRWSRPVLPAFWIATEDHDIEEVNRVTVDRRTLVCQHGELAGGTRPPVGWLSLQPWRDRIIDFARRTLGPLPHGDAAVTLIEQADYTDYGSLFASLLLPLVGVGRMVLLDPMRLRRPAAPVVARLAERADAVQAAFERGSAMLSDHGHQPQLDRVSLFQFRDQRRHRIELTPDIADQVRAEPERFSPGAALRPIVQDNMLPTAAYIGGPGELMYLWQIDPLYEATDLRRSRLWPRISATLIDEATLDRAARFGLEPSQLFDAPKMFEQFDPRQLAEPDAQLRMISEQAATLAERIRALRGNPVGRAADAIRYHADRVVRSVLHDQLTARGLGKDVLRSIVDAIQPHGLPQERIVTPLEAIARFGPDLPAHLLQLLDSQPIDHRLVIHDTTQPTETT